MRYSLLLITTLFLAFNSFAETVDKTEQLNGVSLKSSKEKAVRTFNAVTERTFPYPLTLVKKAVTNFTEKCNNAYKDKRKFSAKEIDCKYHNENLVETFIVNDIRPMESFKGLSEFYLVGRQVYNRGNFGFYELATIRESVNEKSQKTISVVLKMLNDADVRLYTTPKFEKASAFDNSTASYTLTELAPNITSMTYEYTADTDHWLLNKEVSVPQVFASISKSVNDLVKTVEAESSLQKRELASKE
jgi:hypothetical protein